MSHRSTEYGPGTYVFDSGFLDADYACSAYNTGSYWAYGIAMPITGLFCEVEHEFGLRLPQDADRKIDYAAIVRKIDRLFARQDWQLEEAPQANVVVLSKECVLRGHHDGTKAKDLAQTIRREFFSTVIVADDDATSEEALLPVATGNEQLDEQARRLAMADVADIWPPYAEPLYGIAEVKVIRSVRNETMPPAHIAISGLERVLFRRELATE